MPSVISGDANVSAAEFGYLDGVTSALQTQIDSKVTTPGGWTSYTPTWTNMTIGNAQVTARYSQVGKIVHVQINMIWGSTTSASGNWYPSVPVTASSTGNAVASIWLYDDSASAHRQGNLRAGFYMITDSGAVNATSPFTWTTGDQLNFSMTYEAA